MPLTDTGDPTPKMGAENARVKVIPAPPANPARFQRTRPGEDDGWFAEARLISAAAVQVWGDSIGEIFVDTLAQHRRRGYARMVTRAATRWLLEETSLIPQYDAELTNPASLRVAQAIGYEPYGCLFVVSGT